MNTSNPLGLSFFMKQQAAYSRGQAVLRMLFGQVYILIPHGFILLFLSLWAGVLRFLAWWSILFTEKYPVSWFKYQVNVQRWNMRVSARMLHLLDGYPAFGLHAQDHGIIYEVAYPEKLSRWTLLLKTFLGIFMLLPHLIVLVFRFILVLLCTIIFPLSILFTTNYPASWHRFVVGTLRWSSRVSLYFNFMRDEYPPFHGASQKNNTDAHSLDPSIVAGTAAASSVLGASAIDTSTKTVLERQADGSIIKKTIQENTPIPSYAASSARVSPTPAASTPNQTQASKQNTINPPSNPSNMNKNISPEKQNPEEKNKKSIWPWILAGLLALTTAGLVWLFADYSKLDGRYHDLLSEKTYQEEQHKVALDSLHMLIDNLNTEAIMLRDQIEHPEKNERYQGLMNEYNSLKDRLQQLQVASGGGGSSKLKKEIAALKTQIEQLEKEITTYKTQISGLESEKTALNENINAARKKVDEYKGNADALQQQIDEAAKLDFEDVIAGGIKYKSEEKKKDKPKAKSLNKIQVCFAIAANKIAKAGPREIYVRIIDPSGQVLKRGEQSTTIAGQTLDYTINKTQDYRNKEELVCMYYDRNDDSLAKGNYSVEIYCEDRKVGESKFTLK